MFRRSAHGYLAFHPRPVLLEVAAHGLIFLGLAGDIQAAPPQEACDINVLARELPSGQEGARLWTPTGPPTLQQPFQLGVRDGIPWGAGYLVSSHQQQRRYLDTFAAVLFPLPPFRFQPFRLNDQGTIGNLLEISQVGDETCGAEYFAQAILVDPSAPGGLRLTNAVELVAGGAPHVKELVGFGVYELVGKVSALGDFDGDGLLDLVGWDNGDFGMLALAREEGGFQSPSNVHLHDDLVKGLFPVHLNPDTHLDLVMTHKDGVVSLLGNGDGTFQLLEQLTSVGPTYSSLLADLNNDGILDLVLGSGSEWIEVLLGDGDGTFSSSGVLPLPTTPWGMQVGDLDGDGDLDLAACGDERLVILINTGAGSFQVGDSLVTGSFPYSIELVDMDGDAWLDAAVANISADDIYLFCGLGNGSFASPFIVPTPPSLDRMWMEDLDHDDSLDIITVHHDEVHLFHLEGGFNVVHRAEYPIQADALSLGDVNGDGLIDVVATTFDRATLLCTNSEGEFDFPSFTSVPNAMRGGTALPLPGDRPALAILEDGNLRVLRADADGAYVTDGLYPVGTNPKPAQAADLDGDGILDLVVGNVSSNDVSVLLGTTPGTFQDEVRYSIGAPVHDLVLTDLNGDGHLDLATASSDAIRVRLGMGDGTLGAVQSSAAGSSIQSLAIEDFDGDGLPDAVVANHSVKRVTVALGLGTGEFTMLESHPMPRYTTDVEIGDFNEDGVPDVVATWRGTDFISSPPPKGYRVFQGAGDGTLEPTLQENAFCFGRRDVEVCDLNRDGHLDLALSGDACASFWAGDGTGAFVEDHTVPARGELILVDLDQDGTQDFVYLDGWNLFLIENRLGQ